MFKNRKIPEPTKYRLIQIDSLLDRDLKRGEGFISSTALGKRLGVEAHTIRRDIHYLGGLGDTASGYSLSRLREKIRQALGLQAVFNACVVGLGKKGSAILHDRGLSESGVALRAGFDVNVNKLETLRVDIDLFPAYEMEDVIRSRQIVLAFLAVPVEAVDESVSILIRSGIKGILNYTGAVLPGKTEDGVVIRNMNIADEVKMLKTIIQDQ